SIGITVFTGMIASTCLAVLFVPPFFVLVQGFEEWRARRKAPTSASTPAELPAARGCDTLARALVTLLTKHECGGFERRDGTPVTIWTQGFVWYSGVSTTPRHPWHPSRPV